MPQVIEDTTPIPLRPFTFFGVELRIEEHKEQAVGTCPFCQHEEKFFVNKNTGQWDCKRGCGFGNVYSFLTQIWDSASWSEDEAKDLSEDRGILVETINKWELRILEATDEWIVAGYNAEGKISNLYKRVWNHIEKRWYWRGPKGLSHGLFGLPLFDQDKDDVFICEGIWDAMILWETLRTTKQDTRSGEYLPTSNTALSLLDNSNVIAVASATVFSEYWTPLFAGKRVYLCYDNDHPAAKTGVCGALEGMKHGANLLLKSADPPKEVHYIKWGDSPSKSGIVGYNPDLKHGYDLRDVFTQYSEATERRRSGLSTFFSLLEPVPTGWIEGAKGSKGKPIIPTIQCEKFSECLTSCQQALSMSEGMIQGLVVMLACAALVEIGGDQLWIKFIGPPASGKTTLADGLIMAKKYAVLKSITTGLHSGYKDKESSNGTESDFSMMNMIRNMAVVIKDGDTLMKSDNLTRILSELRDAYDRKSATHFRNGVIRNYEGHSFALLLFGTNDLSDLDQSELGQRFIDCVMMEGIDAEVETSANKMIWGGFKQLMASQVILNGDRLEGSDKQRAKQIIGGYLEYLRRNALHLVSEIRPPDDDVGNRIDAFAKFVATFRGRPSTSLKKQENYTREMSGRLLQQFGKLAYGLAMVLNKSVIDVEVMNRVKRCALDTARGITLKIATALNESVRKKKVVEGRGKHRKARFVTSEGLDAVSLSQKVNVEARDLRKLLIYLRAIDVVEIGTSKGNVGLGSRMNKWKLTPQAKKLYQSVMV